MGGIVGGRSGKNRERKVKMIKIHYETLKELINILLKQTKHDNKGIASYLSAGMAYRMTRRCCHLVASIQIDLQVV